MGACGLPLTGTPAELEAALKCVFQALKNAFGAEPPRNLPESIAEPRRNLPDPIAERPRNLPQPLPQSAPNLISAEDPTAYAVGEKAQTQNHTRVATTKKPRNTEMQFKFKGL